MEIVPFQPLSPPAFIIVRNNIERTTYNAHVLEHHITTQIADHLGNRSLRVRNHTAPII